MINSYPKKYHGAAVFLITTILLISVTLIILFAANYTMMQQKIGANISRNQQAFQAAEAGLEYGIKYLQQNSATILASKVGGFVQPYSDSNTTNVSLANGSKYSITYSNPVANDYTIILVSSTGTNDDATATKTVQQLVKFGSLLFKKPQAPIVAKGNVSMNGNNLITNLQGSNTIQSGGGVTLQGSSLTQASNGVSSSPGNLNSDVIQNNSSISSQSVSDFFASYFGVSMATVKNSATYVYSNLNSYGSTLNGKLGATIWIDQTSGSANISGNVVIGSVAQPVLLIVNGDLDISGNTTIYGMVVVLGTSTTDITGSTSITGGLLTTEALSLKGTNTITFNSSILTTVQQTSSNYYAKVPGSWRDF